MLDRPPQKEPEIIPRNDDAPTELVVIDRRSAAEDVILVTLGRSDGGALPPWTAGAHLELTLPSGTVRQYSLCGDPDRTDQYRIAVLRVADGRGGSVEVHQVLRPGVRLTVRGPRNTFPLVPAEEYLLLAGGIGITPLLPMITELDRQQRSWRLVYAGRTRQTMAFTEELPDDDRVEILPRDENGRAELDIELKSAGPDSAVYCCGPPSMIDAVTELSETHLPAEARLCIERFTVHRDAPDADTAETNETDQTECLRVRLARTGQTITVPPSQTILNSVREAGADVPSSCEEGICGTCEIRVLAGIPDHRDDFLTEDERAAGQTMMLCVSRALTDQIELDL